MPPADNTPGGAAINATSDPLLECWTFAGDPAGPAGELTLPLDGGAVLSLDAADPAGRLVNLVVDASDGSEPSAASALTRSLLGAQAEQLLSSSVHGTSDISLTSEGSPAVLASAWRLAQAKAALSRRPADHPLRELDCVLHSVRVGLGASAFGLSAAWTVWPTVTAFARANNKYPSMLNEVPGSALAELRARLQTLLPVIERDDPSITESAAHRLVTGLVSSIAPDLPAPLSQEDVDREFEARILSFQSQAREELFVVKGDAVHWEGSVEDFTSRLGAERWRLHPGRITADGRWPGEVTVQVPVALGITTDDLRNIVVRAVTDTGTFLAETRLEVAEAPSRLPVGRARLTLSDRQRTGDDELVVIDLARSDIAAPDRDELARLGRERASNLGQQAVALAASGDFEASARLWAECADQFGAIGDRNLQQRALDYASEVRTRDRVADTRLGIHDWLEVLLDGTAAWVFAEINRIVGLDDRAHEAATVQGLRDLVSQLDGWNEHTLVGARARVELAEALRDAPGLADDSSEVEQQLIAATQTFYSLRHEFDAQECLQALEEYRRHG